jgi:hypothetical protein
MAKTLFLVLTLLLVTSIAALSADVTGKWVAQVPGRGGEMRQTTFDFKADGDKLTGTMSGFRGDQDLAIQDGKISGDDISFSVVVEIQGEKRTMNYTGKVAGSELKLKREGGRGPQKFTAKRADPS